MRSLKLLLILAAVVLTAGTAAAQSGAQRDSVVLDEYGIPLGFYDNEEDEQVVYFGAGAAYGSTAKAPGVDVYFAVHLGKKVDMKVRYDCFFPGSSAKFNGQKYNSFQTVDLSLLYKFRLSGSGVKALYAYPSVGIGLVMAPTDVSDKKNHFGGRFGAGLMYKLSLRASLNLDAGYMVAGGKQFNQFAATLGAALHF